MRDLILESPVDDDFSMPPEDVEVETALRHPDYRRVRRMPLNDIALLKLRRDLTFSGKSYLDNTYLEIASRGTGWENPYFRGQAFCYAHFLFLAKI